MKAARGLLMAMSTDTVTEGRTRIFQKEGRIMPVDHRVDRRPRMWRNRAAAKTLYIRLS